MVKVTFTVEVNGAEKRETYDTETINNHKASYLPKVALKCAKSAAIGRYGDDADLSTVTVKQIGRPGSDYDETGSTGNPT
jgi:nucleoside-triphosphatase THEP1